MHTEIILKDLPKISLNDWYSGNHWSKRKKIKDIYKILVKRQFKKVFSKKNLYDVDYKFYFSKNPLDASNCTAMLKLIEDIIFEDDNYNCIKGISIESVKSKVDQVIINVYDNS